jgi:hypothetical protein
MPGGLLKYYSKVPTAKDLCYYNNNGSSSNNQEPILDIVVHTKNKFSRG